MTRRSLDLPLLTAQAREMAAGKARSAAVNPTAAGEIASLRAKVRAPGRRRQKRARNARRAESNRPRLLLCCFKSFRQ